MIGSLSPRALFMRIMYDWRKHYLFLFFLSFLLFLSHGKAQQCTCSLNEFGGLTQGHLNLLSGWLVRFSPPRTCAFLSVQHTPCAWWYFQHSPSDILAMQRKMFVVSFFLLQRLSLIANLTCNSWCKFPFSFDYEFNRGRRGGRQSRPLSQWLLQCLFSRPGDDARTMNLKHWLAMIDSK